MPWKVSDEMEQRYRCIEMWRSESASIKELAGHFGVARKTIYKWIERYEEGGMEALASQSRRPHVQGRRIAESIEGAVIELRGRHPSWGPDKLKRWLERNRPEEQWPARSTIGLILERAHLNGRRKVRRHATPSTDPLIEVTKPNQVWGIDFKGYFVCGDRQRCDPLTVTDTATRYLLCCRSMEQTNTKAVQAALTEVFREYGLPERMRSDNGSPFASTGVGGLTHLSVWWIKLGIIPERIEPGEPQQNGRHERMHRTLKQDTAQPPAPTLAQQQQRFDEFVNIYNHERPHQALDGATPSDRYQTSAREFPEKIEPWQYADHMELRKADERGKIRWKQARCRLGTPLANEVVALETVDDGLVKVWFGPVLLGLLDERDGHSRAGKKLNGQWAPLQSPSGLLARRPLANDQKA